MTSLDRKVQETFDHSNVSVNTAKKRIEVYWMRSPDGKIWVPYGGGPLYHDHAKEVARWLGKHIEEFRSLLPKEISDYPVVVGELDCRSFPSRFIDKP